MAVNVTLNIGRPRTTTYNLSGRDISAAIAYLDMRHGCWGEYRDNSTYESPGSASGQVTEVTITASPTIQMPRWTGLAGASAAEQAEWNRMSAALTNHENAHHEVYRRAATRFRNDLRRKRGLTQEQMQTEFENFLGRVNNEQQAYDRRTRNGANDGVTLTVP
jgi:predicted secreted Zn-dependent protease